MPPPRNLLLDLFHQIDPNRYRHWARIELRYRFPSGLTHSELHVDICSAIDNLRDSAVSLGISEAWIIGFLARQPIILFHEWAPHWQGLNR